MHKFASMSLHYYYQLILTFVFLLFVVQYAQCRPAGFCPYNLPGGTVVWMRCVTRPKVPVARVEKFTELDLLENLEPAPKNAILKKPRTSIAVNGKKKEKQLVSQNPNIDNENNKRHPSTNVSRIVHQILTNEFDVLPLLPAAVGGNKNILSENNQEAPYLGKTASSDIGNKNALLEEEKEEDRNNEEEQPKPKQPKQKEKQKQQKYGGSRTHGQSVLLMSTLCDDDDGAPTKAAGRGWRHKRCPPETLASLGRASGLEGIGGSALGNGGAGTSSGGLGSFGGNGLGSGGFGANGFGGAPSLFGGGNGLGGFGGLGGGGGGAGPGFYCFSADMRVRLASGQLRRMDELRVGDWVHSANDSHPVFSRVDSWIHKLPSERAEFLRIEMDRGPTLKLTAEHFIYKTKCLGDFMNPVPVAKIRASAQMVYGEQVRSGDCLFVTIKNAFYERRVRRIQQTVERGIFAPMTGTGDIVVEGVLASCYSHEESFELQRSVFNKWSTSDMLLQSAFEKINDETKLPFWLQPLVEFLLPAVLPNSF